MRKGFKHTDKAKELNRIAHLGKIAWNKGLTKETDERVKRIVENTSNTRKKLFREGKLDLLRKGKKYSEIYNGDYSKIGFRKGEQNPSKRPENREKISRTHKGRIKSEEERKKLSLHYKGKTYEEIYGIEKAHRIKLLRSQRFKGKKNPKIRGENNGMWNGGSSFEPYGIEFNQELKQQIRQRDNYTCQECGFSQKQLKYTLDIHHIDFNKKNNSIWNLISLCRGCHTQTQFNREKWINYFQNKLNCMEVKNGN